MQTLCIYSDKIQEVIANIASNNTDVTHPMLERREVKKTGYIISNCR